MWGSGPKWILEQEGHRMKAGSETILAPIDEGQRKYSAFRVDELTGKVLIFFKRVRKKVSTRL